MTLSCSEKIICIITQNNLKNKNDFYCLNCLHSFRTENKLKSHEKIFKNKDFCRIVMPTEKNKVLKFNQYIDFDRMPYISYTNIESLI